MQVAKMLPSVKKPYSMMNKILEKQGFIKKSKQDESYYQTNLQDTTTQQQFLLVIPSETSKEREDMILEMGQAYIEDSERIPPAIVDAAKSKLVELSDYLEHNETEDHRKEREHQNSLEEIENGNMTKDFEDMKRLGQEMEQMETDQELRDKGKQPDPKR